MATSSITANFDISDKETAEAFVRALEWSAAHPDKTSNRKHLSEDDVKWVLERIRERYSLE